MENSPEYLYHYTNIETLALILANHTFRLTSLDQMDDLQEKEAFDLKNAGQFCYVSSWTDDETENIPMWKMYSSLNAGVRIKLLILLKNLKIPLHPYRRLHVKQ